MIRSDVPHFTIEELKYFIDDATISVTNSGRIYLERNDDSYTLYQIIEDFAALARNNNEVSKSIITRIKDIKRQAQETIDNAGLLQRTLAKSSSYIGKHFWNYDTLLETLEFPGSIAVTSKKQPRLLVLRGEKGLIACNVTGKCSLTIPRLSENKIVEFSTRSFLRMRNLTAVRGSYNGARMLGPCSYLGNLETPHKYKYTIDIDHEGTPLFLRQDDAAQNRGLDLPLIQQQNAAIAIEDLITTVPAIWHKGTNTNIREIQNKYQQETIPLGPSLFPNAGILEINTDQTIVLAKYDARLVDLSPFKARLVNNQIPFQITEEALPSSDEYRVITYLYEPQYAEDQVMNGGGLFLETHAFSQTITPLDENCGGFVTLARWTDDSKTHLEIIGVEIPYGYTLIVDKDCIHGDTNITGMFMMCMTSNHRSMQTANTVFLKSFITRKNIAIVIADDENKASNVTTTPPLVSYYNDNDQEKKQFTRELNKKGLSGVIFNPFYRA